MSEQDRHKDPKDPNGTNEGAIHGLIRSLSEEEPRAEFAARLRADFAAGKVESRVPEDTEELAARSPGKVLAGPWRWLAPIAAAAAILLFVLWANQGPGLDGVAAIGNGTLFVDGEEIPFADIEARTDLFDPGAVIRVEGDMSALLDVTYPGLYSLQITAGVEMTLPDSPGRWFGRVASFGVGHGEVRVVTGPEFAGASLLIDAPGVEIEVLGTTLAVICSPCSTCVCVLEGTASMREPYSAPVSVEPMTRRTVFNDNDDDPLAEPIRQMEQMKLEMLRDAATPLLQGALLGPAEPNAQFARATELPLSDNGIAASTISKGRNAKGRRTGK